jgi:hypothetical protein
LLTWTYAPPFACCHLAPEWAREHAECGGSPSSTESDLDATMNWLVHVDDEGGVASEHLRQPGAVSRPVGVGSRASSEGASVRLSKRIIPRTPIVRVARDPLRGVVRFVAPEIGDGSATLAQSRLPGSRVPSATRSVVSGGYVALTKEE